MQNNEQRPVAVSTKQTIDMRFVPSRKAKNIARHFGSLLLTAFSFNLRLRSNCALCLQTWPCSLLRSMFAHGTHTDTHTHPFKHPHTHCSQLTQT